MHPLELDRALDGRLGKGIEGRKLAVNNFHNILDDHMANLSTWTELLVNAEDLRGSLAAGSNAKQRQRNGPTVRFFGV